MKNCECLIEGAIDSVLDQDFPHNSVELIFVDDGSEDNTLFIIESYTQRIDMKTSVFHHKWRGLGATRNVVVKNAKGKYIIWVDCDMRLSREFIRKQVEFMDERPDVGIGKGEYGITDKTSIVAYLENIEATVELLNSKRESLSKPLGTGGSIYRVEAIRKVGGFDESITGVGEDMEVEHKIREAGWVLQTTPAVFFEMRRENWQALWKEYFWHGSGGTTAYNKVDPHSMLYRMFPPTAILREFSRSLSAYRMVHRKIVFLLPLHWIFKRTAWFLGFLTSLMRAHAK